LKKRKSRKQVNEDTLEVEKLTSNAKAIQAYRNNRERKKVQFAIIAKQHLRKAHEKRESENDSDSDIGANEREGTESETIAPRRDIQSGLP